MRRSSESVSSSFTKEIAAVPGLGPDLSPSGPHERRAHSLRTLLPAARWSAGDIRFDGVADSADQASPGDLVIHRVGDTDPIRVMAAAMARGAAGILTEQWLPTPLPQCLVTDLDHAEAAVWSELLDHPDRRMLTIGVVGSAGKSTTALLIANLFRSLGVRTAYQTDLGCSDGVVPSTPGEPLAFARDLVRWFGDAADCGSEVAIVELGERQLRHGTHDAIGCDLLVITGTADPKADFGPTAIQCATERVIPGGAVIAPADDAKTLRLVKDSGCTVVTYGTRRAAEVTVKLIEQEDGLTTSFLSHGDTTVVMESALCGGAMAANHAAAATVGVLLGQPLERIAESLGGLRSVPGRMQSVSEFGSAKTWIDAAGTPARAAETLRAARQMRRTGRLWCVLALSGNESPETLARYGAITERFADRVVLTAASQAQPQFLRLSHAVLDGVRECAAIRLVANHQRAVRWAVSQAGPNDSVVLLGAVRDHGGVRDHGDETLGDRRHQRDRVAEIDRWIRDERERRQGQVSPPASTEKAADGKASPPFRVVG